MQTKKCNVCGEVKSIENFYPHKAKNGCFYYCNPCKQCFNHKNTLKRRVQRASRLAGGMCQVCGKRNYLPGQTFCVECSGKYATRDRVRRRDLVSKNLCECCGKPAISGETKCKECKSKRRMSNKKAQEMGLCVSCRKPRESSSKRYCRSCLDKGITRNGAFSLKVIAYFGGKCQICGFESTDYEVYDAHHINPKEKEIKISALSRSPLKWESHVVPELKKCVLLCSNCHRRLHKGRFSQEVLDSLIPGKRASSDGR
jgi:hypothetical protein